MLAGDTNIVYNITGATVFFSDMYEFTTTSNAITPQELIQFMGYTFGVMDAIAEHRPAFDVTSTLSHCNPIDSCCAACSPQFKKKHSMQMLLLNFSLFAPPHQASTRPNNVHTLLSSSDDAADPSTLTVKP